MKTPDDLLNAVAKATKVDKKTLQKMLDSPGIKIIREIDKIFDYMGKNLSEAQKAALGSAGATGLISGIQHGYKWYKGQESASIASLILFLDASLSSVTSL